ncbi:MAG: M20/M25/M40 family metallo-hydrolase [Bacteroidales bacterium]|nr:M20/M25/M40 family metallo-hydrolase [Bacteroidales bacterium]
MKQKNLTTALFMMFIMPAILLSQSENIDLEMMYKIKQEGLKNSQVENFAYGLTDLTGPRLTGSSGFRRGMEWAEKTMKELGFQNVRIEAAGDIEMSGWDNLKTYAAMTAPYYANFACNPMAWTGSTNGAVRGGVVYVDIRSEADFAKYRGALAGKIVLLSSLQQYEVSFEPLASRLSSEQLRAMSASRANMQAARPQAGNPAAQAIELRNKINEFMNSEKVAVVLNNGGMFNVVRSAGRPYRKTAGVEPVAQLNLAVEAHGRIERLLQHGVAVEMEVEIQNSFFDSPTVYNVFGEITGTDKVLKDEVVMIGAHLDSWHGGTGAADNASGCVVMVEALRILKALNASPKRTIRVALWGGEEQGLFGSRFYANRHLGNPVTKERKPGFDKFAGYFNMDNGTGKYRGIYLQENDLVRPIFEQWMKPFADMGMATISPNYTGGTDHLAFDNLGLPGFQFIQDGIEYGRGYHTVMDTYDRLDMTDLRHNAVITAAFAWNAANRHVKLPAKPAMPGGR